MSEMLAVVCIQGRMPSKSGEKPDDNTVTHIVELYSNQERDNRKVEQSRSQHLAAIRAQPFDQLRSGE
jgi:hypothetical protein